MLTLKNIKSGQILHTWPWPDDFRPDVRNSHYTSSLKYYLTSILIERLKEVKQLKSFSSFAVTVIY